MKNQTVNPFTNDWEWIPEIERVSRETKFKKYYRFENWGLTTFIRRFDNMTARRKGAEEWLVWVSCECHKEVARNATSWVTCEKHWTEANENKYPEFYPKKYEI